MSDSILGALLVVFLLVVALLGSLLLSTPLAVFAIRRYAKTRQSLHRRALLVSTVNALGQGLAVAALGFVFVAGIGDESAGNALPLMVGGGLVGGTLLAFLPSYLLIVGGCKRHDRRNGGGAGAASHGAP